jgi:hypothetical protein
MAMRFSTAQVTTASGKAYQAMLLRTSGNMLSLLEDIQRPLLLLHKPTACSKGFTTWLRKKPSFSMIKLQQSFAMLLRSKNSRMPLLTLLQPAVFHIT